MPTLTINNFGGRLTRYVNGDINSGFAKYATAFGYDPFSKPANLTWMETATRVDSGGTVITDLIIAGKERVESGISYVYAIGHLGRLYKIQVNDPTTYNPNYDNPVLLATISSGSPTFTRGGSMDFFGATERIYIGHDKGVTRIDFSGANETVVGVAGSWTQTVPRPLKQFAGKLYAGNGTKLAEIDSTATVSTYSKLSPEFPINTEIRDTDTSVDGNYLEMVVSRLALPDITSTTEDTTFLSNAESYIFGWNGTDAGYTSFVSFPSFSINASHLFGSRQFTFGYDLAGATVFAPTEKILSLPLAQAPLPNAVGSNGNLIGWVTPERDPVSGVLKSSLFLFGSLDREVTDGWWRQFNFAATDTETDIVRIPFQLLVSNLVIGSSSNGYAGNVVGNGKMYFSTLETSSAPTTDYKLYKFFNIPTTTGTAIGGVYETQTQLFSKKSLVKEVRFYHEPLVANNGWQCDLIGSDGTVITNSTKTFTVGSAPVTAGDERSKYNPAIKPVYTLALRVTNTGTKNMTFKKVEIDYQDVND